MIPKRNPDTSVEAVEDELLVLNQASHQVHHLNPSAAFVYECCDGVASVDEIVSAVVARFDVDLDSARHDVAETLTRLEKLELITMQSR